MTDAPLTFQGLNVRSVNVPLSRPVKTSSGTIASAPLVLIDLLTDEGITGYSYLFSYTPAALSATAEMVRNLGLLLKGARIAPLAIHDRLTRHVRLLGNQGITGMAIAGIDMAAWDCLGKAVNRPLACLLGGEARPVPAYKSVGMLSPQDAAREASEALAEGFKALKVKVGYANVAKDLEVVRAVRRVAEGDLLLMIDFNQCLSVPEAVYRCRLLDDFGLAWIEEPTLAEDFHGHAKIASQSKTPIQLGENWWGVPDMAKSIAVDASDLAMLDIMKIGGITGWIRAASLAAANGLPVSSHIFPEFSIHALAASPTCHWLEYLDTANSVLEHGLQIKDGYAQIQDLPGAGIAWNETAVRLYEVH